MSYNETTTERCIMKEEKIDPATKVVVGAGILFVVVGTLNYVNVLLVERKKRRKIEEWKLENLACIENSRHRLVSIASVPDFDMREFASAMAEEQVFLDIVRRQPKY